MKYLVKATHPFLPDINQSFNTETERTNLVNDITKIGYEVETSDENEWESFQIEITYTGEDNLAINNERGEITERFESELYRLVQKYQGQAGLKITATDSVNREIVEY
jgi:hypothetical protein